MEKYFKKILIGFFTFISILLGVMGCVFSARCIPADKGIGVEGELLVVLKEMFGGIEYLKLGVFLLIFSICLFVCSIFVYINVFVKPIESKRFYSTIILYITLCFIFVLFIFYAIINLKPEISLDGIDLNSILYSKPIEFMLIQGFVNLFILGLNYSDYETVCGENRTSKLQNKQLVKNLNNENITNNKLDDNLSIEEQAVKDEIRELKRQLEIKKLKEEYKDLLEQLNDKK